MCVSLSLLLSTTTVCYDGRYVCVWLMVWQWCICSVHRMRQGLSAMLMWNSNWMHGYEYSLRPFCNFAWKSNTDQASDPHTSYARTSHSGTVIYLYRPFHTLAICMHAADEKIWTCFYHIYVFFVICSRVIRLPDFWMTNSHVACPYTKMVCMRHLSICLSHPPSWTNDLPALLISFAFMTMNIYNLQLDSHGTRMVTMMMHLTLLITENADFL